MMDAWLGRFFRDRRVAVLAIPRPGERPPLTSPVWYDYDGARFVVQVESGSAKAKAFAGREDLPVSLTVQSEVPPYRYAVVYGRASVGDAPEAGLRRRLARRYFGRLAGDMYVAEEQSRGVGEESLQRIEIVPQRVVAHDFHPQAGRLGRLYFALYRWLRPVPA